MKPIPILLGAITMVVSVPVHAKPELARAITGSPGSSERVVDIEGRCPTFSWGAVDGAAGFELVVFSLPEGFEGTAPALPEPAETEPALHVKLPGGLLSWTPALSECLERGRGYAWSVRALGPGSKAATAWSAPRLLRVPEVPSGSEVAHALDVLEAFLGAREGGGGSAGGLAAQFGMRSAPQSVKDRSSRLILPPFYPDALFDVRQTATAVNAVGVFGSVEGSGLDSAGVVGAANATTGQVFGVIGTSASTQFGSAGVLGVSAESGTVVGIRGETSSPVGTGVLGEAFSSAGATDGVVGMSHSSDLGARGVYGYATANGTGVHARADGAGPALKIEQNGTGDLISASGTGFSVFKVENDAAVFAKSFSGDGSALTGVGNEVFRTIDAPAGTDPVADGATDALTVLAGDSVTVSGDSAADSLTFDVIDDSIDGTELADTITLDAPLTIGGSSVRIQGGLSVSQASSFFASAGPVVPIGVIAGDGGTVKDGIVIVGLGAGDVFTDALDLSYAGIVNALNVGANTILGTTFEIDGTHFDVSTAGDVTAAGVVSAGHLSAPIATLGVFANLAPLGDGALSGGEPPGTIYYDGENDALCYFPLAGGVFEVFDKATPCTP